MSAARRTRSVLATLSVCAVLASLGYSTAARAQGEGPRAFELAPEGSQAVNVYGIFARGNQSFDPGSVIPGVEVDTNGSIIEYVHGFALAGEAGSLIISLPVGDAVASVHTDNGVRTYTRTGIGDLQLTGVFGLLGSPALGEKTTRRTGRASRSTCSRARICPPASTTAPHRSTWVTIAARCSSAYLWPITSANHF